MSKNQAVKLLLIFIAVFMLAGASYMYFRISHDIDSLNGYNSEVIIPPKADTSVSGQPAFETQSNEVTASGIDTSDWKVYRNEEYGFEMAIPGYLFLVDYGSGGIPVTEELIYICKTRKCNNETPLFVIMADTEFFRLLPEEVFETVFSSLHRYEDLSIRDYRKLRHYLIIEKIFKDGTHGIVISDGNNKKVAIQNNFGENAELLEEIIDTLTFR